MSENSMPRTGLASPYSLDIPALEATEGRGITATIYPGDAGTGGSLRTRIEYTADAGDDVVSFGAEDWDAEVAARLVEVRK